jgi:hypothetical protein
MVNVFSFCLYGPENPRYYPGMLDNIYLAGTYYPTWKVYVYVGTDVPDEFVKRMSDCSNVVIRQTGITGPKNMIHRFFAIDEDDVELMMVRDADSRIHWRDRWCINEFLKTNLVGHTIRDNIEHTAKLMGGLWGMRKLHGVCVRKEYYAYTEDPSLGARLAHDQNFLGDVIYPKIVNRLLVHYSHGRVRLEETFAKEIPFQWTNDKYCGRIEDDRYIEHPQPPVPKRSVPIGLITKENVPLHFINFLDRR